MPENARFFSDWLAESAADFRVGSLLLSQCKFAVFGVGSGAYGDTFNAVAKDLSEKFRALGASEILALALGDVDKGDLDGEFEKWSKKVTEKLKGGGACLTTEEVTNGEVDAVGDSDEDSVDGFESDDDGGDAEAEVVDLEDIAGKGPSRKSGSVAETNGRKAKGEKEMVTPVIRASLEKQVLTFVMKMFRTQLKSVECWIHGTDVLLAGL